MKFNVISKFNTIFEEAMSSITDDKNIISNEEGWEFLRKLKDGIEAFIKDPGTESALGNAKTFLPTTPVPIPGWNCLYSNKDFDSLTLKEFYVYWASTCTLLGIRWKNTWSPRPKEIDQKTFKSLAEKLKYDPKIQFGDSFLGVMGILFPNENKETLPALTKEEQKETILTAAENANGIETLKLIRMDFSRLARTFSQAKPEYVSQEIIDSWFETSRNVISDIENKEKAEENAKNEEIEKLGNEMEITDEVRAKYFKDYGTMNGWGSETRHEWKLADILHDRDEKDHPELHKSISWDASGYVHHYGCEKCKFHYAMDSSD